MKKLWNQWTGTGIVISSLLVGAACAHTNGMGSAPSPGNGSSRAAEVAASPGAKGRSQIGTNVSSISYWTTAWPFVDAFKINGGWISQKDGVDWGQGGNLDLTPDGWVKSLQPGQYAEALIYYDSQSRFPSGNYTILYEGEGTIDIAGDTIVSQAPGRMVVAVKADGDGIRFQLRKTNPNNPVRNIRVIMPGFENTYKTQPFHPLFLERLSKFKVLRFMDWMSTNDSKIVKWSDRKPPAATTQMGHDGVSLEYMIQLANTLKVSPWFNIPHQANDDYVRQFATMVRDRLDPSLKVHIEYSNEVWNGQFSQAEYAQKQGQALGLSKDQYEAQARFYAQRSVEIFKIFEQVFGGKTRLVRVLAWQTVNPDWANRMLTWKNAYQNADYYAIATYFNTGGLTDAQNINRTLQMTPDQILDVMAKNIRDSRQLQVDNYNLARKYNLQLAAYEGGEDVSYAMIPDNLQEQAGNLFKQVSRHPRMKELYREYLTQWQDLGGVLYNQYFDTGRYDKWGHWAALEYQDQKPNTAPKYQGLIDFINANPVK